MLQLLIVKQHFAGRERREFRSESPENIKNKNYIKNIEPSPIGTEDARLDLIISQEGFAEIKIVNIDGEVVKTLINQKYVYRRAFRKIFC